MPPSPPAERTIAEFVRGLTRSGLADDATASKWLEELTDAAKLAEQLVQNETLTRFQAEKLLRGHWRGLTLGKYRILGPIGRGGVGIVYLAKLAAEAGPPTELFAIKVLPPQKATAEPRTLARFQREKEIGLALPLHPHLTRTIEAGEEKGVHFLVLEYVPGLTIRQTVVDSGPLAPRRAARAFLDVAMALHEAHRAGFVHRDLKPANIILSPTGRAKLLDFGFALRVGESTPADPTIIGGQGYTLGTMDYIAPEQTADATAVGPAADLYALGCSLFFALTGSPPFPGGTAQEKIRWHRSQPPPLAVEFNPKVPVELSTLLIDLLAKRPDDRPASAEAVAKRLAALAEPIRATAIGDTGPTPQELVRQVDAKWQSTRSTGESDPVDESFTMPLPPEPAQEISSELPELVAEPAAQLWLSHRALFTMIGVLFALILFTGWVGCVVARR